MGLHVKGTMLFKLRLGLLMDVSKLQCLETDLHFDLEGMAKRRQLLLDMQGGLKESDIHDTHTHTHPTSLLKNEC